VIPFLLFLATGLNLLLSLAIAFFIAGVGFAVNEVSGRSFLRPWLRCLTISVAIGAFIQFAFSIAGEWSHLSN